MDHLRNDWLLDDRPPLAIQRKGTGFGARCSVRLERVMFFVFPTILLEVWENAPDMSACSVRAASVSVIELNLALLLRIVGDSAGCSFPDERVCIRGLHLKAVNYTPLSQNATPSRKKGKPSSPSSRFVMSNVFLNLSIRGQLYSEKARNLFKTSFSFKKSP